MVRALAVVVLTAVVALAAYVGWWFFLATEARSAVEAWVGDQRAAGWRVDYTTLETDGFPGQVRLTIRDVALVPPDPQAGWQWRVPAVTAEAEVLAPRRITIRPLGVQQLELGPADAPLRLDVSAKAMAAVVDLTAAPAIVATGFADEAVIAAAGGEGVALTRLDVRGERLAATDELPSPTTALAVTATDVVLPAGSSAPFGRSIDRIGLDGVLVGDVDLAAGPAGLLRWRDRAGVLNVDRLEAVYGPAEIRGSGTFALDADGQPQAALSARVRGLLETLERLRDRGLVADGAVTAARFATMALARDPADGGRPEIEIDITVRDRVLSAGPVPLMTLPPILWP